MTPPLIRVLYIEDDEALPRLVQRSLERRGECAVEVARDAQSGLRRLEAGGIDVVALDHYLPDQDGLTALAAIRAMRDPPPVVYVTATQDSRVAVAALKAGAVDYVAKDVSGEFLSLLRAAIDQAVEGARLRRAKEAAEAELLASRDRFEALAAERALLLREVNHRVGNSLQIIAALLHLQGSSAVNPEVKGALEAANKRVLAVAQVHRRLYTSDDVQCVALDQYLEALAEDLRRSSEDGGVDRLLLDADPVEVDPDRAVAVGIIVTELVLNALKHAYPGGSGPVRVSLRAEDTSRAVLSVEDDGVGRDGPPPNSAEEPGKRPRGMGQAIVRAMAKKLEAEWGYHPRDRGTRVTVAFDCGPCAEMSPASAA